MSFWSFVVWLNSYLVFIASFSLYCSGPPLRSHMHEPFRFGSKFAARYLQPQPMTLNIVKLVETWETRKGVLLTPHLDTLYVLLLQH